MTSTRPGCRAAACPAPRPRPGSRGRCSGWGSPWSPAARAEDGRRHSAAGIRARRSVGRADSAAPAGPARSGGRRRCPVPPDELLDLERPAPLLELEDPFWVVGVLERTGGEEYER